MTPALADTTADRLRWALQRITTQPAVDVLDAATAFGVSRATAYNAIKAGEWPSIKVMSRVRAPTKWIREQLMIDRD